MSESLVDQEPSTEAHSRLKEEEGPPDYGSSSLYAEAPPLKERFVRLVCSLRIEPVMFLFMFSFILTTTCLTNLMMDKGCRFYLHYSEEVCRNLSGHQEANNAVEVLANNYNLYLNALAPIGAAVVIFAAPWSDLHGRKPLLLMALFGFLVNDVGLALCGSVYFESPLYFILLANLATQVTGGFICVSTIIYSHISDITSSESRSLKYTLLQISFGLAVTLGALTGGQLFHEWGYAAVFGAAGVGHLVAILWTAFLVPETRGGDSVTCRQKLRDLGKAQNFTNGLRTCCKFRPLNGRFKLWMLLLSSCTVALTYEVYTDIAYTYAHHMFHWGPREYSLMWTAFSFAEMVVVLTCTPLLIRVFGWSDPLIGILGSVSIICKNVFLAFSYTILVYCISNITGFFNGLVNLAVRSLISKLVAEDELGRVFSFLATCEAIVPLLGSAIITKIFNATLSVFPGACYLADTVFLLVPLGTFIYYSRLPQHSESGAD